MGGLSVLSTWDVLIHLFVVLGAFFLGLWHRQGHTRGLWGRTALLAVLLVVPAALIYLPFYLGFRSQAGPPLLLPLVLRPPRPAPPALLLWPCPFSHPTPTPTRPLAVLAVAGFFQTNNNTSHFSLPAAAS